ncbi:sugar ABC transporter permease [Nonomuraea sp. NN258]|uniref:sugar ABC transporter permease n=1 Tax=Nonomuraea antri TaxID=2730852 RepID=UPI001569B1A7|nr:sugar ABC transporter permease [Nonomuraea antri]NRQ32044.1 sugar ABC transporter permease [Nonomuraea antri]
MTSPTPAPAYSSALGWLLAVPAMLGTLITLVVPSVQTVALSLSSGGVLRESLFVGLDNYAALLGGGAFWRALWFTLSLTVVPVLVTVLVGPLLAVALDRAGPWPRRAGVAVLSLAVVTFTPTGIAAGWLRGLAPDASGVAALAAGLRDPATAPGTLRLIVAAATFGLICALAVTAFLPALRGGAPGRATLAVAALTGLGVVAVGLQAFSLALALTRGGPGHSTETLAGLQYEHAFRQADFGTGAAVATLTGLLLGALGLVATIVAVATGMRITLVPRSATGPKATTDTSPTGLTPRAASPTGSVLGTSARVAVGVVALVVVVAVAVVCAWPWISALLGPDVQAVPPGDLGTQVNTWVPALAGALVSVGVAYLGALGIGGLRPLGRRSEWLLLPLAPWLFAGLGPLGVADWRTARHLGLIDTFAALVPPLLVSLPALLVLTLLCKGLAERAGGDFFGGVFVPSLPMAGVLTGAVTLVNARDLYWPLLVTQDPGLHTAPVRQLVQIGVHPAGFAAAGLATPPVVVVVAAAAAVAAQLLCLDRLAVTVNGSRSAVPGA